VDGVEPVLAALILGRTGRVTGLTDAAAYANYTGTAPVQIASAGSDRQAGM
jgi:transposase